MAAKRELYVVIAEVYSSHRIVDDHDLKLPTSRSYQPSSPHAVCVPSRSGILAGERPAAVFYHYEEEPQGHYHIGKLHYYDDCAHGRADGERTKRLPFDQALAVLCPNLGTCSRCLKRASKEVNLDECAEEASQHSTA